jgi:hypothetical protein
VISKSKFQNFVTEQVLRDGSRGSTTDQTPPYTVVTDVKKNKDPAKNGWKYVPTCRIFKLYIMRLGYLYIVLYYSTGLSFCRCLLLITVCAQCMSHLLSEAEM